MDLLFEDADFCIFAKQICRSPNTAPMDYFDHPHGTKDKPDGYDPAPAEFRAGEGQKNLEGKILALTLTLT